MTKPSPSRPGLSKSRITAFEQCPRRLWLMVHRPDLARQDSGAEARFATGHDVGALACALHPGGVMIEPEGGLDAALAETAWLIAERHPGPLFEATFQHDGVLVRADILEREGRNGWRLAEVKSSTGPKDYHLGDLATQVWVLREAGVSLTSAAIRHIDTGFVLAREGDYAGLFADADLLDEASVLAQNRPKVVAAARAVLAGEEPVREMGDHCASPFACEFAAWCSRAAPVGPDWPVTILPNGGGKKWAAQGVADLLALDEAQLSPKHARVLAATRDDRPFHDAMGARAAMAGWARPLAFLDFETINPAVPRWLGTRPYQQVPFQFSLHLEGAGGAMAHHEFLSVDGSDPRRPCAEALIAAIPPEATIVAYNAAFEKRVLRELARDLPDLARPLLAMEARTVDLLPVAREHWYHRDQRGSWSIKAVLPTLSALGYEGLEVKDGGSAQEAWLEAADPACAADRRWALAEQLKAYCALDTLAMVAVMRGLAGEG
ncbi:DUF2779 domain-containing protein [Novosphingobium bradum]|uniref:DUF2779 domain-containing protein n=1 Tax=Novosphingobium bradum TaxID=1737444 RepID=A0ABV7IQQ2_9SPHN